MGDSSSRVFTIPSSTPFLPTLATALVDGALVSGFAPRNDPLLLTKATIYLPTRRAARIFSFELLNAVGSEAALLPRILPLGDVSEDEFAFDDEELHGPSLPAVSMTKRRLVLAKLVLKWARSLPPHAPLLATTPSAALALADELARVLDDLVLAGSSFEKLDEIIPDNLDQYWKISYDFLRIVQDTWPEYLREKKLTDPTVQREELLAREIASLSTRDGPIIAAGSTGTLPSVARLLAAIAKRKNGAVVLPGLDQVLDQPSFDQIEGDEGADPSQGHPQYGLKRLLGQIGIKRADVVELNKPSSPAREKLLSEAFRPAASTDRWQQNGLRELGEKPLAGITVVEAADPREEALTIAAALRETLETKGAYAALITPDRALARRVAAELTRWGIAADDSAGLPLSDTEAGIFARLVAEAAEEFAPVPLIKLLRHPLSVFANEGRIVDAVEIGALRGPRPAPGAAGILDALATASKRQARRNDPRALLVQEDWDGAINLIEGVGRAISPLAVMAGRERVPLEQIVKAHREAVIACGLNLETSVAQDVQKLSDVFQELAESAFDAFELTLSEYADVFAEVARTHTVRPALDPQSRIRILGPLEARLVTFDRVALGGLNEGNWPPNARTDAFLNRTMRRELGLNLPERRIGLSAHDFAQVAGSGEVILTRAKRQSGAETVASRFWQRLEAVAGADAWNDASTKGSFYLRLARALEHPKDKYDPVKPPAPRPPAKTRPARLSVTEIRDLVRDPYTIYARHILGLIPLDDIDADPGAAERGIILHEALARFGEAFPSKLPDDLVAEILKFGRIAFDPYRRFPGALAIWWPRFERVARWFAEQERSRGDQVKSRQTEISGKLEFAVAGASFTLTARADRIDVFKDGTLGIYDYKTGAVPTLPQAVTGLEPQLPLEVAIARAGGFAKVAAASVGDIGAIRLSGGTPPGALQSLNPVGAHNRVQTILDHYKISNCDELGEFALTQLKTLLALYADEKTAYRSVPRPKWRSRYGQYDHLARIKEWSDATGGDE